MSALIRAVATSTAANSTTQVFTKPTGTVSGDFMVIHLIINGTTQPDTPPSGWTKGDEITGGGILVQWWYKQAGGSEPADYTFTWISTISKGGGIVTVRSDASLLLGINTFAQQTNTSSTNRQCPSVTPTQAAQLIMFIQASIAQAMTPDALSTEQYDLGAATRLYCMTEAVAAGATGTRTATGISAATSKTFTIAIAEIPATPGDPTGLTATAVSTTQINLAWTDNATTETAYSVERSPTGAGSWVEIATPAANATSYNNTGLTPATQYFYRVRANNAGVYSGYSNTDDATTDTLAPDEAPSNLTATPITASRVDLAWDHDGVNTDGYSIERSLTGVGSWSEIDTTTDKFYSDTGLAENTTYYYRVRAFNS